MIRPDKLTVRNIVVCYLGLILLVACNEGLEPTEIVLDKLSSPELVLTEITSGKNRSEPLSTATGQALATLSPYPSVAPRTEQTVSPESVSVTPVDAALTVTSPGLSGSTSPAPTPVSIQHKPEILRLSVAPDVVDVGDTVLVTWDGVGEWAIVCPSTRYTLFTEDDCRQLDVSGEMKFTIPAEVAGFREIYFTLTMGFMGSSNRVSQRVSVRFRCARTWFYSDEPQAGICPMEPLLSYAAAQHFEHGMMLWVEQVGRYYVFEHSTLFEGEIRKQISYVYDPLEIVVDTLERVEAPAGFFAPVSGFGYVWRGDISASPGFRESLGWALAPEFGYETILQCDDALPSGGRSWQTCYLQGPDARVLVLHPLGGWYLLGEE